MLIRLFLFLLLSLPVFCQTSSLEELVGPDDAFYAHEFPSGKRYQAREKNTMRALLPASTFKVPNTLIGLESGVVRDASTKFKWDGVKRRIESWNQDQTLASAFKNSAVWYYQEIAKRVGSRPMQKYLQDFRYGNADIGGGLTQFWLDGDLRISAREQVDFLGRLQSGKLPVSARSVRVLRQIMLVEETGDYRLYAKTGWASNDKENIGWYVGWVERGKNTLVFAYNCRRGAPAPENFAQARIDTTRACLKAIGWL